MTNLLFSIFAIFLSLAFYFFLAQILRLPTFKAEKAILTIKRSKKNTAFSIDAICYTIAIKLAPLMQNIDAFFLDKLSTTLVAAGISQSAPLFLANVIVHSIASALICAPLVLLSPAFVFVIILLVMLIFSTEIKKPNKLIEQKRAAIESELPRFVSTISQELSDNRDILRMINGYSKSAGALMKQELLITSADMKTGNYEIALLRFERRINSTMLSDVIRGLIAVLRGDDGRAFFEMLKIDMKQQEIAKLKKLTLKRPPIINACSMSLLVAILIIFVGVMIIDIGASSSAIF